MRSVKGVLASLVLLVGFLPSSAGSPVLFEKHPSKRFVMAATVESKNVNTANGARTGMVTASSSSSVIYFNGEKVAAAFAKGESLFDGNGGEKNYQVAASRHDKPGVAEIHNLDTDIDYVLDGTATYITGGTVINSKTIAPNEIRGSAITDGETHRLSKGDVIIVPNGVPHWFKEVRRPFLYFQVKVR